MMALLQPQLSDPPRRILAIILLAIAIVLVGGGGQLALLGGSPYYVVAGLAVAVSAWWIWRGDRRGVILYGVMLVGTLLWALAEGGLDPWRLQARLVAPTMLGIWVGWPYVRQHRRASLVGLAVLLAGFGGWLGMANRLDAPPPSVELAADGPGEWRHYGNDIGGTRFAPLAQISSANVAGLKLAWSYRTGAVKNGLGFEATPIMVGGTLYLCTPEDVVIALDPDTGKRRWQFDPKVDAPPSGTCRGVGYHETPNATGPCAKRILLATTDARLMAVDADTGRLCSGFGTGGSVDLKKGMGHVIPGYYYVTSAPTIVRGKVILGGWINDGQYVGEPSGVIRAFDAVTGTFAWAWDIDRPGVHTEPGPGQTYSPGTPNSWGVMSGDEALGLVYVPTGNSTPDYWGAHRSKGSEKYGSSIVAIDAETGAARWNFQTVHHDVWDYDVSAQPTLIDLTVDGKTVPALIEGTKRGQVFVLDRRNGKPIAPVEERPVPQGPAAGDWLSPTQPYSAMPSYDDTVLTEQHMWGLTPLDQLWCRIKFKQARYEGDFTPPGKNPSIFYPSYIGGINWGGVSVDPDRKLMVVNWTRLANYVTTVPRKDADKMGLEISKDGGSHIGQPVPQMGTPFALFTGPFISPINVPCTQPPFGKIAVVDLQTRRTLWERPLGTATDSGPFGLRSHVPLPMGVPNQGGSLATRGGLTFIGATQERTLRAFDTKSGAMLWKARLPAGGNAAPMSYVSPKTGRQYVVIAAGGIASLQSGSSDHVMAYALPAKGTGNGN